MQGPCTEQAQSETAMHSTITFGTRSSHANDAAQIPNPLITFSTPRRRDLRWRVNWQMVADSERWRERHRDTAANQRAVAQRQFGNITLKAVVKTPPKPAYTGLAQIGPENARTIHTVLLSCCAGYARPPRTEDVIHAIGNTKPSRAETEAIQTFLLEANAEQVRKAWKAGEFTLAELMKTAEQVVADNDMRTTHSIRRWLIIEPAPCAQNT